MRMRACHPSGAEQAFREIGGGCTPFHLLSTIRTTRPPPPATLILLEGSFASLHAGLRGRVGMRSALRVGALTLALITVLGVATQNKLGFAPVSLLRALS